MWIMDKFQCLCSIHGRKELYLRLHNLFMKAQVLRLKLTHKRLELRVLHLQFVEFLLDIRLRALERQVVKREIAVLRAEVARRRIIRESVHRETPNVRGNGRP